MQLYDYQKEYLETLPTNCIMAADLGTGKTVMALAHWERRKTGRPLLIVAPAAKIRTGDWEEEAQNWMGSRYDVQNLITYISYESLRLNDKETKQPRWWKYTGARNGGTVYDIISDECHSLKNPQSKQSRAVLEITKSGGMFIGLSGTPMPNGWIDFAGYSKIFGYTKGITEFKRRYCVYQDYKGFPELVRHINTEELDEQLKGVAFRLTKDQAAKLPDRRMLGQNIHMPPKDSKYYLTCKLTRKDPRSDELLDNSSRLLSVLRQSTTNGRLDNLLSVVNDTSDNILVFYNYISERKAILKALAKNSTKTILRYDGDQHDDLPASDADIKDTILVAHYKSASTGLNLQWANVTIYFSPTYSYQEFEQSIGRTHRNGQTKKCLYYLFNVKGTVDRDIWNCLKNKRDFNEKLWEGNND